MEAKELETCWLLLRNRTPLIGGWLRRKAVESLMKDGSPEAVRALAEAVTLNNDGQAQGEMLEALRRLTNQHSINAVCEIWASTRHADLAQLMVKHGWVASAPVGLRVLSALKVGRLEVVTKGGAVVVKPLLQACENGDPDIARQARQCLANLQNPSAVDKVCARWAKKREALLAETIVQAGYVARQPVSVLVLSALKAGQLDVVTEGRAEVVKPLLKACKDSDVEIAQKASRCIAKLKNAEAIDVVCAKWAAKREEWLTQVVEQGRYVAQKPVAVRVLSALKMGQLETIFEGGAEVVEPLLQACEDRDPNIAERARLTLRQLQKAEAREALCRLVIEHDLPTAREAALDARYAPHEMRARDVLLPH